MGFVQGGTVIHDGDNLAVRGAIPAGIAAQGQVIWRAAQPWQFIDSRLIPYTTATTAPMDTTDAVLIVVMGMGFIGATFSFTDNQNNVWTQGSPTSVGPYGTQVRMDYCTLPVTSSSHTITWSQPNYSTMIALAFKGPATLAVDQSSGIGQQSATSLQSSPITPSKPNSLIIAALGIGGSPLTISGIDSGFSMVQSNTGSNSLRPGSAAYLVQSIPSALQPTWTWTAVQSAVASLLSFKPS